MESTLFKNAALLDPLQPELLAGHDVLVEDSHIKDVSDRPLQANGARIVDLKGNARTSGERRRQEGGNIFNDQIRVGVAVYFCIKKRGLKSCRIRYEAVRNYAKSDEKRDFLQAQRLDQRNLEDESRTQLGDIAGIDLAAGVIAGLFVAAVDVQPVILVAMCAIQTFLRDCSELRRHRLRHGSGAAFDLRSQDAVETAGSQACRC